jgi:hypothetical protein
MNNPNNEGHDEAKEENKSPSIESLGIYTDDVSVRFRLNYGLEHYPGAFAAYLTLEDVTPYAIDLIDRFQRDYVASYLSREGCCLHQVEMLGWTDKLNELRTTEGIPEQVLHWDYDALWEQIAVVWDAVETDDGIYLFAK